MSDKETTLDFDTDWSYSPAPQSSTEVKLRDRYNLFIGGKYQPSQTKDYLEIINPATEEKLSEVPQAGAADIQSAVEAAREAYTHTW